MESSRTPALPSFCGERVLAVGAVDRRRLEQLPAVEDRLRVDPRRAAAGRADREVDVRVDAVGRPADPGENGPGDHLRPDLQVPSAPVAVAASTLSRATVWRLGALRARAARRGAGGCSRCRPAPASPCRSASPPCGACGRPCRARRRCSGCRRRPGGRCTCRASSELPDLLDHAVVDGDDRRALVGEDVDAAPGRRGGDHVGGVAVGLALARRRPLQRRAGRDVVGVAGVGGDREVGALGEPGQRADQVRRQLAVGAARRAGPPATYQSAWL